MKTLTKLIIAVSFFIALQSAWCLGNALLISVKTGKGAITAQQSLLSEVGK